MHSYHVPYAYGLGDTEPVTWSATRSIVQPSGSTQHTGTQHTVCNTHARTHNPKLLTQQEPSHRIEIAMHRLHVLEQDQRALTQEFATMHRVRRDLGMQGPTPPSFFRYIEPPAHWLQSRPQVVCLFRALQNNENLMCIFETWAAKQQICTWTDVNVTVVYNFIQDTWKAAIGEAVGDVKHLMVSQSVIDSFKASFGVQHVASSHVWTGTRHALKRHTDAHAFTTPMNHTVSDILTLEQGTCILPEIVTHTRLPPTCTGSECLHTDL